MKNTHRLRSTSPAHTRALVDGLAASGYHSIVRVVDGETCIIVAAPDHVVAMAENATTWRMLL